MTPKEKAKIRANLIKACKVNQTYTKEVDDLLIDSIVFNLVLIESAIADTETRGQMINLRKQGEEPFYQINFSVSVFHNAVKSNNTLLKQLGLEKVKVESDGKESALNYLNQIIKRKYLSGITLIPTDK